MKETAVARKLHNNDTLARTESGDRFVRIACTVLCIGRTTDDIAGVMQHVNVIIVSGTAQRIGPGQVQTFKADAGLSRIVSQTAEIMKLTSPADGCGSPVFKIALPDPRSASIEATAVCGAGEIQSSRGRDIVNSLRDGSVLEG